MRGSLIAVVVLLAGVRQLSSQASPRSGSSSSPRISSDGAYLLRQELRAGSVVQTYPRPRRECVMSGPTVQSGWVAIRRSWWVVLDTVVTCPDLKGFVVSVRVDSGIVGGTPDGRGWEFLRGPGSPLPGFAAILRQSFSYVDTHRLSDTVTLFGMDSSHALVYVRPRAP